MKIGFVLDDGLDRPDGVQQYIMTMGNWLEQAGHEVHYLVGQTVRSDIPNIHSLSRNVKVTFNHNNLSIPLGGRRSDIKKLLAREKFDVLHVQLPYSPLMAGRIIKAATSTTAIIGTFHIAPYSWLERLGVKLLGSASRGTLTKFTDIVAVSPVAALAAKSYGLKELAILPNVVDMVLFAPPAGFKRQNKKLKIVYLGRLVERKGARGLLKAICALPDSTKAKIEVRIGGRGALLAELKAYVNKHNLSDIISFDGFISEIDKPAFLANADIAVFPSTGGESFGISLLEAMAAGSGLTLGGNNPGYAGVLSGTPEALVNSRKTKVLAAELDRFILDENLRTNIGRLQMQMVKTYDVQAVGPKLVSLYKHCITRLITR